MKKLYELQSTATNICLNPYCKITRLHKLHNKHPHLSLVVQLVLAMEEVGNLTQTHTHDQCIHKEVEMDKPHSQGSHANFWDYYNFQLSRAQQIVIVINW